MAKNKSKRTTASSGRESTAELTRVVERLDRELVQLISERARVTAKLAQSLLNEGRPLYDSGRDQEQLRQALASNKGPLSNEALSVVLRDISSGARALVKPIRVAYLGPPYSYSHQAATERFGTTVDLAPVGTIAAVFEELNRGHADYGIVPLENSTDGRVTDTLDMFARHPIRICGEVPLRIHHNLLAKCDRQSICEVYSKPQALSQCREWLSKHLPGVRLVEMTSTAAAAQLAADRPGAAAVASLSAATHYGLQVLAANIEDNRHNLTRFAVLGGETPRRTGHDKTALMLELAHRPGSLAEAMLVFKNSRLNLTWIESFPSPRTQNEYVFFVECEGHQADAKVRQAIDKLARKTARLDILGSYPRGQVAD